MQLSARNQIPARVTSINAGEAIANVELAANGVRLVASITVEAVRELGLAEGSNVAAAAAGLRGRLRRGGGPGARPLRAVADGRQLPRDGPGRRGGPGAVDLACGAGRSHAERDRPPAGVPAAPPHR